MVNNWFVDYYTNPGPEPVLGACERADRRHPAGAGPRELARRLGRRGTQDALRRGDPEPGDAGPLHDRRGGARVAAPDVPHAGRGLSYAAQRNDPIRVMAVIGILAALRPGLLHTQQLGRGPCALPTGAAAPGLPQRGLGETPDLVRRAARRAPHAGGQQRGLHRRQGHPARARQLAVRQEHEPRRRAQQGLAGSARSTGSRTRPRISPPASGSARSAAGWATRRCGAARWRSVTARRSATTWPVPRRSPSSAATGRAPVSPACPSAAASARARRPASVSLRVALGDFHDRGPTPYRRAFNEVDRRRGAGTRPRRPSCRTCPAPGRTSSGPGS